MNERGETSVILLSNEKRNPDLSWINLENLHAHFSNKTTVLLTINVVFI